MAKKRLLYIAGGNPVSPRSGTDLVVRAQLEEVLTIPGVELRGTLVAPGALDKNDTFPPMPWPRFSGFVGDLQHESRGVLLGLRKAWFILTGGILAAYSFRSAAGRRAIHQQLREQQDCIVIDGITPPLANIGIMRLLWAILVKKNRLVFIAHDATPNSLRDNGKLKTSRAARLLFAIQSKQAWFIELLVCRLSSLVVFHTTFDQACYQRFLGNRSVTLCPVTPARSHSPKAEQTHSSSSHYIFMGPLDFPPNTFAFKWICTELAPQLYEKAPQVSIVLVGKGTDALPWATPPNVKGLGFVSEADLRNLLETSIGMLSPIIHGSGIKTKVLEGLAAGCPVLATEESLRGFDFMELSAMLRLDDTNATSSLLADFAADKNWQASLRQSISKKWEEYVAFRSGRLAKYISDLCHQ